MPLSLAVLGDPFHRPSWKFLWKVVEETRSLSHLLVQKGSALSLYIYIEILISRGEGERRGDDFYQIITIFAKFQHKL